MDSTADRSSSLSHVSRFFGHSVTSVTDTTHSSSANVLLSWCPVVVVPTSFGRHCWLHRRQDLCDDLKRLFLNVPNDHLHPFPSYDICTCRELFVCPFLCARLDHHHVHRQRALTCCVENGSRRCCGPGGTAFAFVNELCSMTIVDSCAVATTGDFLCRNPQSASLC